MFYVLDDMFYKTYNIFLRFLFYITSFPKKLSGEISYHVTATTRLFPVRHKIIIWGITL